MRAYELDDLTAYFGSETSSAWKFYSEAFEKLSDEQGKPRIALTWTWAGFFLGPLYLFMRKSYLVSFVLLAACFAASYAHMGAFFAAWCAHALIAPYFIFRRFLAVLQASKSIEGGAAARREYIGIQGGISWIVGILAFFS